MTKALILALVGPTGSGKSTLALDVARRYDGEIIAADSRTVYRHLDIGTAKPTVQEMAEIPHHLIDVVDPSQRFSVADFQRLAKSAIEDIQARGKLPIIAGGSGLYIDALLYGFSLRATVSDGALEELSDDELRMRLDQKGIVLNQSDRANRRRLIRAVTAGTADAERSRQLSPGVCMVGLDPGLGVLEQRIGYRTQQWFKAGLLVESQQLFKDYGRVESLNTTPYKELSQSPDSEVALTEAQKTINLHLRQLAKRQLTWLRRNSDISWAANPIEANAIIDQWHGSAL